MDNSPVRQLRTAMGLTQAAFAARVGIAPPHISAFDNGGEVGKATARKIVRACRDEMAECGVTLEMLLWGEGGA